MGDETACLRQAKGHHHHMVRGSEARCVHGEPFSTTLVKGLVGYETLGSRGGGRAQILYEWAAKVPLFSPNSLLVLTLRCPEGGQYSECAPPMCTSDQAVFRESSP